MGIFAVVFICFWILLMLWASVRWYPATVDRVGHFVFQMMIVAGFVLTYFGYRS